MLVALHVCQPFVVSWSALSKARDAMGSGDVCLVGCEVFGFMVINLAGRFGEASLPVRGSTLET